MNLLINEPSLQVLPSLAAKIGLNEALFLQQLHFRLLISNNLRDEHRWVYKTYEEWRSEFPFWSYDTVKRTISRLEKDGYIVTTSDYNKMKMDKTKWYRINYSNLGYFATVQNAPSMSANCTDERGQIALCDEGNMHRAIPKEIKSIKNNNVEQHLDVVNLVIDYLNKKANKNYKSKSSGTRKFVSGRLHEGYSFDDFKRVIDIKTKQWLNNQEMNVYLRPSTLFSPTNFENYLNENQAPRSTQQPNTTVAPFDLDFNAGEDIG